MGETVPASPTGARCIIRIADKLIVLRQKASKRLTVPGGKSQQGEPLQCAAHRNTWEQTGFNVSIRQELGKDTDGTTYYDCAIDSSFTGELTEFPVPKKGREHVREINLRDPFVLSVHDWDSEQNLIDVRRHFNKVRKPTPINI